MQIHVRLFKLIYILDMQINIIDIVVRKGRCFVIPIDKCAWQSQFYLFEQSRARRNICNTKRAKLIPQEQWNHDVYPIRHLSH